MTEKPTIKIWLTASGLLILVLGCVPFLFFESLSAWYFRHIQLHSTMETLGGITAVLIAVVLFSRSRQTMDRCLVMVSTGFVSMGVLDTAHAISLPGDSFVFLHSAASFVGAFFFALVWFAEGNGLKGRFEQSFMFFGSIILSLSIGIRALVNPNDVPKIMPLFDGTFTIAAVIINTSASILFLISVPRFYILFRRNHFQRDLLFMFLAFYFGVAEMIFQFSRPWDGIWWIWHLIRLLAYIATLIFVSQRYIKKLTV